MEKPKLKASEILKLQDNVKKLEKLKKCLSYLQEGKLRTFATKPYVNDFEFTVERGPVKSFSSIESQILAAYLCSMIAHYESIIPFEIEPEEDKAAPKRMAVKKSFDDEDEEEDEDGFIDGEEDDDEDL